MKISLFTTSILMVLLTSCANKNSSNLYEKDIAQYLDKLEIEYEAICKQAGMEVWEYYSDTSKSSMGKHKELFSQLLLNDSTIANINNWSLEINKISNDTLIRRLALWKNIITCAQVDFSPEVMDLQSMLETQLSNYPSPEISDDELEHSISKLIHLRNLKAKRLGYGNYAYMVLQTSGIDTLWFEKLIHKIDSGTSKAYTVFIQNHFPNQPKVEYKDLRKYITQSYLIHDDPVIEDNKKEQLIYETLTDIGIDLDALPIQFKITELPQGIGGFGNCIDIPNDFRAVAEKELSFYNLIHEMGHGLYGTNVSTKHPVLKGYEWCTGNLSDVYGESMGEVMGRFSQNKTWMKEHGFNEDKIDSIQSRYRDIFPMYLRLNLINSLFEIELYKNPNKVPAIIKQELYKKYLNVNMDFSKKPNLIRFSYVAYPVYEQNYLIADIVSWQIHKYLLEEYGENYIMNKEVRAFLKEKLWKDGELYTWQKRVKEATGKKLDLKGYLKDMLE